MTIPIPILFLFDLIQFHLGTFSPSRFHVRASSLVPLSFPLFLFFLIHLLPFLSPFSLQYQPTQHHFLPPTIFNFSPFSPFSWSQSLASSRQADSDLGF